MLTLSSHRICVIRIRTSKSRSVCGSYTRVLICCKPRSMQVPLYGRTGTNGWIGVRESSRISIAKLYEDSCAASSGVCSEIQSRCIESGWKGNTAIWRPYKSAWSLPTTM